MNDPHGYPQPKTRLPPRDQLVMGVHAVQEILRHAPERLLRVFIAGPKEKKTEIERLCKDKGIPVSYVPKERIEKMTGSETHQSIAAHVKGRKFYGVKEFLEKVEDKKRSLLLMVDQVFDPQNFGGLIRSAECFGADGIIWSKNRGSDLTPASSKASSGASELIPLIRISNLADAMGQFQKGGFEAVASGFDASAESAYGFSFAPKTLLIVGSEGEGIQPLILKKADRLIYLPMMGKVASLNVGGAAASFMALYQNHFFK